MYEKLKKSFVKKRDWFTSVYPALRLSPLRFSSRTYLSLWRNLTESSQERIPLGVIKGIREMLVDAVSVKGIGITPREISSF